MQNNRFVVLTGHLSNYPLSDLVGILRHQRKSGRLTIEYPKGPAIFFFDEGALVDAQFNELTGLQAICVAISQPEASFNFNPLIQPSRRTVEASYQRVVSELFGCWDESALQVEASVVREVATPSGVGQLETNGTQQLKRGNYEPLQLPPAPLSRMQRRPLFFIAAVGVLLLGLSAIITVTGGFSSAEPAAAASKRIDAEVKPDTPAKVDDAQRHLPGETAKTNHSTQSRRQAAPPSANKQDVPQVKRTDEAARPASNDTSTQPASAVKVVLQIENGRVTKASIVDHQPGMDTYESLALRIARQRRFPANQAGQETVKISVTRPN